MNKLVLDLETTGLNCYSCEMITGRFELMTESSELLMAYDLKSQVDKWSEAAAKVHNITFDTMNSYTPKKEALDGLCNWLSQLGLYEVIIFANPNTEFGRMHYDVAVLQMELMNHLHVNRAEEQPFKPQKITSVYTMAKEAYRSGLFEPINKISATGRNLKSFTQSDVYYALFNEVYYAHDAKEDVKAMKRIYFELMRRQSTGDIHREQLSLL